MRFELQAAKEILARTPATLDTLLRGLPDSWTLGNEGPETWSPFDVVGHLIHGETTDWIPRIGHVLRHGEWGTFEPFDRFAHIEISRGKSVDELLDSFRTLRKKNLDTLDSLQLTESQLALTGQHPDFGKITLGQLLSTWVVHDLGHIGQVVRAMAHQYSTEVGPWKAYLRVLGT